MTSSSSTASQLRGKKIKKKVTYATIVMNILSVFGILLLLIISKLHG